MSLKLTLYWISLHLYKAAEHGNLLKWILSIQTQTASFECSIQFCSVQTSYHSLPKASVQSISMKYLIWKNAFFKKLYILLLDFLRSFLHHGLSRYLSEYGVYFVGKQENILIQPLRYMSGMQVKYWFLCWWGKFRSVGLPCSCLEVRESFSFSFWLNSPLALQ